MLYPILVLPLKKTLHLKETAYLAHCLQPPAESDALLGLPHVCNGAYLAQCLQPAAKTDA